MFGIPTRTNSFSPPTSPTISNRQAELNPGTSTSSSTSATNVSSNGSSQSESAQSGRSLQNSLISKLNGGSSTQEISSTSATENSSKPTVVPRTIAKIIDDVASYDAHETKTAMIEVENEDGTKEKIADGLEKTRDTGTFKANHNTYPKYTFVEDQFHKNFNFEQTSVMGKMTKGADGKVNFEKSENNSSTHFTNYFNLKFNSEEGKAVMSENYKNPDIKNFNATDVFFSQYAKASGSIETFPASLPATLPRTIVRDTVDGLEARRKVFEIFNGTNADVAFDDKGAEKPLPNDQKEIVLQKGTPGFQKAMETVNAKSTGHIVNDFNTLKDTNHAIESIKITRTGWATGIKMEIKISGGVKSV